MLDSIARTISFIFNPLFLLLPIPYLLVMRETGEPLYALKWSVFTLMFVVCIGLFVLIAVRKKLFSDLDVSTREQRPLLFLFVSVVAVIYFLSLFFLQGPVSLLISVGGIFLSILVFSFFLNIRLKASIHGASIAAFAIAMILLYGRVYLLSLLLIPLIGWSRVRINRHTKKEVIVGTITGIILTVGMYLFFKVILGVSISGKTL